MCDGDENVKKLQDPANFSRLFKETPPRFFGEPLYTHTIGPKGHGHSESTSLPSPSDFSFSEFPPNEVSNDIEVLRAINLKMAAELKKEKTKAKRLFGFTSRLAKKLACLGQLSSTELKTSFSLGIRIEVSNIHWLLYRGLWTPTRDIGTETETGKKEESFEPETPGTTVNTLEAAAAYGIKGIKPFKFQGLGCLGVKDTSGKPTTTVEFMNSVFNGIPAIKLPMPGGKNYTTSKNKRGSRSLIRSKKQRNSCNPRSQSMVTTAEQEITIKFEDNVKESEQLESFESIIILHKGTNPLMATVGDDESKPDLNSTLGHPKDSYSHIISAGNATGVEKSAKKEGQTYPNGLPIDYESRLEELDKMNENIRSHIKVAMNSAKDITNIASYINKFVNERTREYECPIPLEFVPTLSTKRAIKRKSHIPIRITASKVMTGPKNGIAGSGKIRGSRETGVGAGESKLTSASFKN